nr:abasic site processing protein HMCES-like [Procambarus clarkii]
MCGRTACTLAPDEICKACSRLTVTDSGKKQYQATQWQDHPGNYSYSPSCNMAPSRFTPVMISDQHVQGTKRSHDGEKVALQPVIQPMMWGLIPPFYKGSSPTGHGFKTINCRSEDIEEKKTYKPSLNKGQRCVILCDGFYEWQTTKGEKDKQPYFIYASQPKGVEIWNQESWNMPDVWSEEEGWKGPQLLKMAGIFSHWFSTEGEEVWSYSLLTMDSGKKFSDLHHRMPAILETDQDVEDWLDFERIGYKDALMILKNDVELTWHPVSSDVNNVRNQEPNLNAPVSKDKKPPDTPSSRLMSAWLSKGTVKNVKSTPIKNESLKPTEQKEKKPSSLEKWLKKESDQSTGDT